MMVNGQTSEMMQTEHQALMIHKKRQTMKPRSMLQNQGGGELTTKGLNGRIRSKDTIKPGNDPCPPKDKEH